METLELPTIWFAGKIICILNLSRAMFIIVVEDSVTYYPAPSRKPESVGEDVGKRVFKARHCNFAMLRIGKFQVS